VEGVRRQVHFTVLASQFWSVVVIVPHLEYDVFHGLITKWTPILSLQSLNQTLSDFTKNTAS
jgi:hypothetical protein